MNRRTGEFRIRDILGIFRNGKYVVGDIIDAGNLPFQLIPSAWVTARINHQRQTGLAARHVVFCISPGRSGSSFLANLMSGIPDCCAAHEPNPKMNGSVLRAVERIGLKESYDRRLVKILAVNSALGRTSRHKTYFESNHMFIKTFADVVCDFYKHVDVIVLRRQPSRVIKSFGELAYFTPRNPSWKGWMNDPALTDCRFSRIFKRPDQIDRIIAYLISIEEKTQALRAKYAAIRFHDWRLEDLIRPEGAKQLILALGLSWSPDLVNRIVGSTNTRTDRKEFFGIHVPEQICVDRLNHFYQTLDGSDLDLPDIRKAWVTTRP